MIKPLKIILTPTPALAIFMLFVSKKNFYLHLNKFDKGDADNKYYYKRDERCST